MFFRCYLIYLIYFRGTASRATVTGSIWYGENRCAITIFVVLKCSPLIRLSLAYTIFQQVHSISVSAYFPFVLYRYKILTRSFNRLANDLDRWLNVGTFYTELAIVLIFTIGVVNTLPSHVK